MARWIVWISVLLLLSWYLYIPLPSDIDSPMAAGLIALVMREAFKWGKVAEDLGYGTEPENARSVFETIANLVPNPLINSGKVTAEDSLFDGVPVKVYRPKTRKGRGAIVYFHGGGFTILSPNVFDSLTSYMAAELHVPVISVDYRLAPKHRFPAAFDDCVAATLWFVKNSAQFGVDPARIAVMGDSAGGNLAAAVSQELTINRGIQLRFQCLVYPSLQTVDLTLPSFQQNDNPLLSKSLMAKFVSWYLWGYDDKGLSHDIMANNSHVSAELLRHPLVKERLDRSRIPEALRGDASSEPAGAEGMSDDLRATLMNPIFSPLLRSDLSGLPPAYIITAGLDILRDDGILYADRLAAAGVDVTWKNYPSGSHSMFALPLYGYSPFKSCLESFEAFFKYAKENL